MRCDLLPFLRKGQYMCQYEITYCDSWILQMFYVISDDRSTASEKEEATHHNFIGRNTGKVEHLQLQINPQSCVKFFDGQFAALFITNKCRKIQHRPEPICSRLSDSTMHKYYVVMWATPLRQNRAYIFPELIWLYGMLLDRCDSLPISYELTS